MDLRLDLATTDFGKLTDKARALIPALEPEWTDHNAHDPGIMLVELLAWVAEAQIYSLSRLRRDERRAYARLLGHDIAGAMPATGLVWPNVAADAQAPGFGISLPEHALVSTGDGVAPPYRLFEAQYVTAARLGSVTAVDQDGNRVDLTRINLGDGATFLPFGPNPGAGERLELTFQGRAVEPGSAGGLVIGFDFASTDAGDEHSSLPAVAVAMRDGSGERPLAIRSDTTAGFSRSGVIILETSEYEQHDASEQAQFTLILRPHPQRMVTVPRLRRIAANVLRIEQVEQVVDVASPFGTGLPDQIFRLTRDGLRSGWRPKVTTHEGVSDVEWQIVDDFADSGPDDAHALFDAERGEIEFGNGVNGRKVPPDASIEVSYEVCAGPAGDVLAGQSWQVRGIAGIFGLNAAACRSPGGAVRLDELQSRARRSLAQRRTFVTSSDLEAAAVGLAGLGVARARELARLDCQLSSARTLLVVGTPLTGSLTGAGLERQPWLAAIRERLAPGVPLGQRLTVIAPAYVRLRLDCRLLLAPNAVPEAVATEVEAMLKHRFFDQNDGHAIWQFGRDVALLTVKGWMRSLRAVVRVAELRLFRDGVGEGGDVAIGPTELPILDIRPGDIRVERLQGVGRKG